MVQADANADDSSEKFIDPAEHMTKIVYNGCFGCFGLSEAARTIAMLPPGAGTTVSRTDPALVQVVEELGAAANGAYADLQIAKIPVGTRYRIDEYDGNERVMTIDDYDWATA